MALVGNSEAATLTGKDPSTIRKHAADGTLSFQKDAKGRRRFEVSELVRVYGELKQNPASVTVDEKQEKAGQHSQKSRQQELENARLQERVANLESRLSDYQQQTEDLKQERDDWKEQAKQNTRLLTDEREKNKNSAEQGRAGFFGRLFGG